MHLIFLHGPVASGKLTIARRLAERTGFALFHNHLAVDAVGAVFPFGSAEFVRLRERWWLDMFAAAANAGRSLIFTFAPEDSVSADFPERVQALVESAGGRVSFVGLTVSDTEQERRLVAEDRAAFGKLRSVDLLRELREMFRRCEAAMPAGVTVDTMVAGPDEAAESIIGTLRL